MNVTLARYPALERLLKGHQRVSSVSVDPSGPPLAWEQDGRQRCILVGDAGCELKGLVELMDNNPLVCADEFSVPSPAATLALIALGPLARAGLIEEPAVFITKLAVDEQDVRAFLATMGFSGELEAFQMVDLPPGLSDSGFLMTSDTSPDELDELFAEAYGRSFFVKRAGKGAHDAALLKGARHAVYTIKLSACPKEIVSLRVTVSADPDGKCGAAQIVHAFNVMCGFEESLGL